MKKIISLIYIISTSQFLLGQESLMDSIKVITEQNNPNNGVSICTPDFWDAEFDGGKRTFKQLCRIGTEAELKISDKKTGENRAILVIDFLKNGIKKDEIYLYAIKNENQWLMDGFNETKSMFEYFLANKCSGHFNPTSLPTSLDLENIAKEMLKYTQDIDGLNNYLKKITTDDSEFSSVSSQFTDKTYHQVNLSSVGYSEELGRGYIYFKQLEAGDDYESGITIYLKKTESGKYKIYDFGFIFPSARSFFN